MLDTGSTISLINFDVVHSLKLKPSRCQSAIVSYGNNTTGTLNKCLHVNILFQNKLTNTILYPVKLAYDVLLGLDYCFNSSISIICRPEKHLISAMINKDIKDNLSVNLVHVKPDISFFCVNEDTLIKSMTTQLVKICNTVVKIGSVLVEPHLRNLSKYNLMLSRNVNFICDFECEVFIDNYNNYDIVINKGTQVAYTDLSEENNSVKVAEPDANYNIDKKLDKDQANKILSILGKFKDIFSKGETGLITNVKHRIITEDCQPVHQTPYRVSASQREIIQTQISEMLDKNIIKPSESPWSSPVILVKKANGQWRMCVDYRKLNAVTKKDRYPLPRIDDTLDLLVNSTFFSTLDMCNGYWHIEIDPRDREKSAFITSEGLYEFNVLSFGLCNAPSSFQRAVNSILGKLRWDKCLCYLDDIIIFGKTFEEHCERLHEVLKVLNQANLKLQKKKCSFGYRQVKFLGHLISEYGVKPDPSKTKALENFAEPSNINHVRSFLGLASYYRKFIKNFAKLSHPLNELLQKDKEFIWDEDCQNSFNAIKQRLTEDPILIHFHDDLPIFLYTDASGTGIGAVLAHKKNGKEHVVAYCSRTLNKHEKNYPITEQECLAIVWSVTKFRHYLLGHEFTIVTDHHPLCFLNSIKNPSGRLARWALRLSEYSFNVIHQKGSAHKTADCMSRFPLKESDPIEDERMVYSIDNTDLNSLQNSDAFCSKIKKRLTSKHRKKGYFIENDILYRQVKSRHGFKQLICLPLSMVEDVCKEFHDTLISGHLGQKRTYQKISERFYRPKLPELIQNYVKTCTPCQTRKTPTLPQQGLLQTIPLCDPFEILGIDFLGPFPKSSSQNQYIIVLTDYGTRWAEAKAVRNATAESVAKFLIESIFLKHGFPKQIVSDRGSQFLSNLVTSLLKELNVKHTPSTSFHPQTNGLTERFNKTLTDILSMYTSKSQNDWDKYIPYALFSYNTSVQASTNETPFKLVYARDPILPIDITLDIPTNPNTRQLITKIRKEVKDRLERVHLEQAAHYNANRRETDYSEGELVLVYKPLREVGKSTKLLHKWGGPYKIIKKTSPVNYELLDLRTTPPKRDIHPVSRIKRFNSRSGCNTSGYGEPQNVPSIGQEHTQESDNVMPNDVEAIAELQETVSNSPDHVGYSNNSESFRDRLDVQAPETIDELINELERNSYRDIGIQNSESSDEFRSFDNGIIGVNERDDVFESVPRQNTDVDALADRFRVSFRPANHGVPDNFQRTAPTTQSFLPPQSTETQPIVPRRSKRMTKAPDRYGYN